MNKDTIISYISSFLVFVGGFATAKGWFTQVEWSALSNNIVEAMPLLFGIGLMIYKARTHSAANVVTQASEVPGVTPIKINMAEASTAVKAVALDKDITNVKPAIDTGGVRT